VPDAEKPESLARAKPPQPRLGLPQLDQLALTSFTTGDATQLVEHARDLAGALAAPDGDTTRRRTIARALSVTRSQTCCWRRIVLNWDWLDPFRCSLPMRTA